MEAFFPDRPGTLDPAFAARRAFVDDLEADPPATWWKQVRAPVLVLNGGKDSQVPADENAAAILEALEDAPTDRFESRIFPDKNHLFQDAKTGAVDEYGEIDQTVAPEVLEHVAGWLETVASSSAAVPGPDSVAIEPGSGNLSSRAPAGTPTIAATPGSRRRSGTGRSSWPRTSRRGTTPNPGATSSPARRHR